MKHEFIEKNFREESLQIIRFANVICHDYAQEGYDLSLRQLYYQFVSKNLLENTERNYKRLGSIVSDARMAGLLDWNYIKDRGRKQVKNSHWTTPSDILNTAANSFRLDLWEDQEDYIIVMVEKQALEGVLLPVCEELDVALVANKGYSSQSMMYEIGRELSNVWYQQKRNPIIIYLGDHDPSGIDMIRDVGDRLEILSETASVVDVIHLALTSNQISEYKPPPNPAKLTDTRAAKYIQNYGNKSWELDALEPTILANLVRDEIVKRIDMDKFNAKIGKQEEWKDQLRELAEKEWK